MIRPLKRTTYQFYALSTKDRHCTSSTGSVFSKKVGLGEMDGLNEGANNITVCNKCYIFFSLVKVLHHVPMLPLARELVPFFLMTCAAMELKQDSLIVQVMDLADQTTAMDTLMTLVWCVVKVSK